jgi:RNA-binding protein
MALNTRQRQYLKGLAHSLSPVVRIGRSSLTPTVVTETRNALESHELIKIRIETEDPAERKALASQLAAESGGELVNTIGKVAILYRARDEDPDIVLPKG